MRFPMILLLASLYWVSSAQAADKRLPNFPVLGYVEGNLLYVPTYRKEHMRIPQKLFAYGGGQRVCCSFAKK
ncbi:MAG: hypothetical protein KJ795_13255 [Gammaproteobacteria bacterium]|nr:hypothetical protein [Gammaproteobacteria bacterium]MBU1968345.1 hypothetical protein [Gammaproteobacteria bacterium]